jgi:very-short-patch-repair endonuclease
VASKVYNLPSRKQFRKKLRNSLTPAESLLWKSLQRRQLLGRKFRRQAGIGRYIVDFYCPDCALVIELDGEAHFSMANDESESERTRYLELQGLKILRFENKELYDNLDAVLETIKAHLQSREQSARLRDRPSIREGRQVSSRRS